MLMMLAKFSLFLLFFVAVSALQDNRPNLRVMTFDTYNTGIHFDQGLYKIVKHILSVDADLIAIQRGAMDQILPLLGSRYQGYAVDPTDMDVGIITKHEIDLSTLVHTPASVGFKINLLNSKSVYFHSLHLDPENYGPYNTTTKSGLDQREEKRVSQIQTLINSPDFQIHVQFAASGGIPLIVAGNFESPSHLDWIARTKRLHGDCVYEWPASKLLSDNASLSDSFRVVNPDPLYVVGNTWSTCYETVYDRIDFILYNSPKLIPVDSFVYSGCLPLKMSPNHKFNDFPSNHYAVVTDFLYA
uniref:Endo/exonuclease/phosphatase domain-containing protein n=1 Tax=Panagrellus redivivus TaxID=6233 RepID=A0A7E4UXW5_PANRE